jgi:hypothetical protein
MKASVYIRKRDFAAATGSFAGRGGAGSSRRAACDGEGSRRDESDERGEVMSGAEHQPQVSVPPLKER